MATLVLSSIGTALGGPVGGALGSLVGQSIDQQLLGPGIRKGPRLGDLSVQTSNYGSPIPRLYGTMRVAGTVVWATDLQENEAIEGGAKGAPEQLGYRYTASFAVALSSRPIRSVRRIWADGKLLRGEAGDFKVRTGFRLALGDEDQPVDPLIASIETIDRATAFRGLALAVFEDLELAEFGNRIPMLTFEVEADEEGTQLCDLLRDASGGLVETEDARPLPGYAAHGRSVADSLAPLIDLCGVELSDRGERLVDPSGAEVVDLSESELGCRVGAEIGAVVERQRSPASAMPSSLSMTYYEPARDYQAGLVRASGGAGGVRAERVELPAALSAGQAKALVEEALARNWRAGDRMIVRLPPARLGLRPGDRFRLPGSRASWTVNSATIEGLAVIVEAEATRGSAILLDADAGRAIAEADRPIGRSELALFELPSLGEEPASTVQVGFAVSSAGSWKTVPVDLTLGGQPLAMQAATRRAVLGRSETVLAAGAAQLLDMDSSVVVQLIDEEQQLRHADQEALMAGGNLALVGDELVQFGRAEEIGPGRYRLSQFLRGRRGTEWAVEAHAIGERFCLIDGLSLRSIDVPASAVGATLEAVAHGVADRVPLPEAERILTGEAMRPLSPCHLRVRAEPAALEIEWVGRSYPGLSWVDGVGEAESAPAYRVMVEAENFNLSRNISGNSASIPMAEWPGGAGTQLSVAVATIGAQSLSHPARAFITL